MGRVVLAALLVLGGCPSPSVEVADSAEDEMFLVPVAVIQASIEPDDALDGLALAVRGEGVRAQVEQIGVELTLANLSTSSDCAVAIYASETPPDASALYVIDPAEDPPAEVLGLGELVAAENLPRIWEPDPMEVDLAWWADLEVDENFAVELYYSVVTCVDASLTLSGGLSLTGHRSDGSYADTGDWSVERSW